MSKPREFAHLIRNKFGSADNISNLRVVEAATNPAILDETSVSSTVTSNLSAGNSNSLPGHCSQVTLQVLFYEFRPLTNYCD